MTSLSAIKAGGRRRKGGTVGIVVLVFQNYHYTRWSLVFLEKVLNSCLPMGSSE